jgi:hypothetical protein
LAGASPLAFGETPVTVEQLESFVAGARTKVDAEVANHLARMELTERLSSLRLARCRANLQGSRARVALLILADRSAFLDPPAADMPAKEPPDLATQRKMIALTVDYVTRTMRHLPNLYATRVTTTFERDSGSKKPLHPVGKKSVVVLYRDGEEKIGPRKPYQQMVGLATSGEFGPILKTVMLDSVRGNLIWSHWEQGTAVLEAVYRYSINSQESHYKVDNEPSAYQGEIAIDPSNGAILRIVFTTDRNPTNPMEQIDPFARTANISVEYGPVDLGERTYICPLRGIALSNRTHWWSETADLTWLNDTVFENYHLFRSNIHILPGFQEVH